MIEFTLYGQMYGNPTTRMSDCPCTSTSCCLWRFASVISWTASVSPAVTPVILYGASMRRNTSRRIRVGAMSFAFFAA